MSRTFTIDSVYNSSGKRLQFHGGRYVSSKPSSAACKAFTQVSKTLSRKTALRIAVRETTRGSAKQMFSYRVKRVKHPNTVERNGEEITYKYIVKAKAI
jgi:hypothetical protein